MFALNEGLLFVFQLIFHQIKNVIVAIVKKIDKLINALLLWNGVEFSRLFVVKKKIIGAFGVLLVGCQTNQTG